MIKESDIVTQFDYLLNRFERASQSDKPAEHNYAQHRQALYAYVRDLERLRASQAAMGRDSGAIGDRGMTDKSDIVTPPKVTGAPETIYLIVGDITEDCAFPDCSGDEVTWCVDKEFESDIKYVRADLASQEGGRRLTDQEKDQLTSFAPSSAYTRAQLIHYVESLLSPLPANAVVEAAQRLMLVLDDHNAGRDTSLAWSNAINDLRRALSAPVAQQPEAPTTPKETSSMKMIDGVSRRQRLDLITPEERALFDAVWAIEKLGAHPLLTDAVVLIAQARDKLADWVELKS